MRLPFTPLFAADLAEWAEVSSTLTAPPALFWYASAGLDASLFLRWHLRQMPSVVQKQLPSKLLCVATDYSRRVLQHFKSLYSELDEEGDTFSDPLQTMASNPPDLSVEQMIPLRLFEPAGVTSIRARYPNFHHSVTDSALPDDDWHACYTVVAWQGHSVPLLYVFMENLAFWKEVCEPLQLRVPLFAALRVGGKSGSWDRTHHPEGHLWQAIQTSALPITHKPCFWIADAHYDLDSIWRNLGADGHGHVADNWFGVPHYLQCQWSATEQPP